MKKITEFILVGVVLSAVFTGCSKNTEKGESTLEKGVLKVGVNISYPPFEYYAEDGKTPLGFDIDLGKAVAEKMGDEAQIIDVAWEGIFAGLDTDKYDVIISAVTITPERTAAYEFSKPYVGNGQSLILHKGSAITAKEPHELAGLRVGYLTESTSDIYMTKLASEGLKFTPEEYDDMMNAFADLSADRCDAVVSDSLVSADYVKKADSPYELAWQGPAQEFFGIAIKKGNTKLLEKVNEAMNSLYADGSMKKMSEKNFGMDIVTGLQK